MVATKFVLFWCKASYILACQIFKISWKIHNLSNLFSLQQNLLTTGHMISGLQDLEWLPFPGWWWAMFVSQHNWRRDHHLNGRHKGTVFKNLVLPLEKNCRSISANEKWYTEFRTKIECRILCTFSQLSFSAQEFTSLTSDKHLWEEYMKKERKIKELKVLLTYIKTRNFLKSLFEQRLTLPLLILDCFPLLVRNT